MKHINKNKYDFEAIDLNGNTRKGLLTIIYDSSMELECYAIEDHEPTPSKIYPVRVDSIKYLGVK